MHRQTIVIASALTLLVAFLPLAAPQGSNSSSSSSSGLAGQVAELENEVDDLQDFALDSTGDVSALETMSKRFENTTKDLEAQDRLGNFEIQQLMSRMSSSETLASNVQKKINDSAEAIIGKIAALETSDDTHIGAIGELVGRVDVLETALGGPDTLPARQGHFLAIADIAGESTDTDHPEEIEVLSWSWGATQVGGSSSGSGAAAGKVNVSDISITKVIDRSSPTLFLKCAQGTHIPEAIITVRSANRTDYLVITLEDVLVSSYQTGGSLQDVTEQVSLRFGKITMEYVPLQSDGTPGAPVSASWNVATSSAT